MSIIPRLYPFVLIKTALQFFCISLLFMNGMDAAPAVAQTPESRLASGRIIAVIPTDSPPTYFLDKKTGNASGFAVDALDLIAYRAGLQIDYIFGDGWTDIVAKINSGKADLVPDMGVSEERKKTLVFTDLLEVFPVSFFVRAENPGLDAVPGIYTVGVIQGSVAYEKLKGRSDLHFVQYDSFVQGLFDLLAGKIEAFACPVPTLWKIAQESGVEERIKVVDKPITEIKRAIAVRKDNAALLEQLNKGMKGFVGSPDYQRVYAKWYGKPTPYWTPGRIAAVGIAAALIIIVIMAGWRYLSVMKLNQVLSATISERDRAEKRQQDSENKYRKIFENIQDVFYQTDMNGHFTDISPSIFRYTEYPREELIGKPASMFYLNPDDREKLLKILQEKGEVADYEALMKAKDGRLVHASVNAHFIYNASGETVGVEGSLRDITERKRAEDAIKVAKEEWERTFDAIAEPIMILDTSFHIVKANKAMADALGVTRAGAVGIACYEYVHGTKHPPELCPHARLLADGKAHTQEVYEQRLGGHYLVSVSPLYDNDGRLTGSIHTARNIDDIKRAEEVLQKSEKKLRDITACQGEGLYVIDGDGKVTFMNPEAEHLLGWTEAELRGKNIHDLVHCRKPDGAYLSFEECPMHRVFNTGERFMSRDEVFIRKDGTVFPVSIISTPLIEDEKVVASITSFLDISEWKKLEHERESLIVELQKALAEIKTLHGILPICSYCKKIRDDKGSWHQLEKYISEHTDALMSHGLCQECAKKMYPEYYKEDDQ